MTNTLDDFEYEGTYPNITLKKYKYNHDEDQNKQIVTIPDGVTCIARSCFEGSKLTSLTFNSTLKVLDYGSFYFTNGNCPIYLPESLEEIGANCFLYNCASEIIFPTNCKIKTINEKTFYGCKIKNMILPNNLEAIKNNAFENCHELRYVYIPKTIKEVAENVFKDCHQDLVICLESSLHDGFCQYDENKETIVKQVIAGWDYHTHVGDPDLEEVKKIITIHHTWNPNNYQILENVSLEKFYKMIK